ncbi:ABC transporter ATP-binding protein [Bacillus wiedmannii]|uniref:ABC transporter ATP-binding protein n=1 Tax=Bacillus wiedmannii TaxID=1890302 RepID=A0A0J7EI71_9BACI|nr:ABC transporter ATP-binding protein [Bacillus wiedmannii]KMP91294.1 multidrug ABC transporter ATP-binding protein [Bacillus wiedmannii]MCU5515909.1 ABC transporter ATP-binding protein/permease [Bacillus wiedmannii]PEM53491.1 ABC transporter ATP-binding protein [Bacillus wiedmannii]PEP55303.1 ABC transporter ATP-binding protein [Bacillus wiedmannii]PFY97624.1 ABC transporter ATP-binding protein [Bacillus wiedmannii]
MLKIFKYLKQKEWILIVASIVFIAGQVWLDLKLPDFMSEITTLVQTKGSETSEIWAAGGKMLLCALGSMILSVVVGYFAARVATSLSKELRKGVFNKTLSFSMEEINGFSTASLITRSTNDITQIQQTVAMGLQVMIKAPILAVWAILKITGKSWEWSAATGVAVVALLVMIGSIIIFVLPKFKVVQKMTDNLNLVTREGLTGIRVVHAYNAQEYQEAKFEKANEDLTDTNLLVNRLMAIMQPGMGLIMSGLTLSIYWIGAHLIMNAGGMDRIGLFSDMVVFSSYAMQVVMAFMLLAMTFIMLPRASVSAARINEVLDTPQTITDGEMKASPKGVEGEIELRNVSFKYPDAGEYVLKDISFTAHKGETVAFIGSTGSGKSTLINLIPRFYDVSEGEVIVDGINVKEYAQEALHNKFGYVSQKAVLFSGTVKSNVAYGDNGQTLPIDEDIKKAVEIAQGKEFVEKMDGEYNAAIAQGGTNLSGGQKQRLSIARAVSKNPEIFIFDDSFSALDYKTDHQLRSTLKKETKGATTLIVAQRIGTIKDADKIIVLDEGKIVGMGTHDELLKTCKTYQEIAYSQLSKEELGNA